MASLPVCRGHAPDQHFAEWCKQLERHFGLALATHVRETVDKLLGDYGSRGALDRYGVESGHIVKYEPSPHPLDPIMLDTRPPPYESL